MVGATSLTISNGVVSNPKLANVPTQTLKGRSGAGTGQPQDLTAAQARALLNVEDGSEANQTDAEIKTQYEANANTNAFTDAEQSKLGGIEAGAQNNTNSNAGTGVGLVEAKSGSDTPIKSVIGGTDIDVTDTGGDITIDFTGSAGGAGTYNEATKDGASISTNRSILEFRDSGDATVTVTDDAGGDRTIIEVNATAGGGGGGVGAGTPFVVGDLTAVSSAAGDGEIISTGVSISELLQLSGGTMTGPITMGAGGLIDSTATDIILDANGGQSIQLVAEAQILQTAATNISLSSVSGSITFTAPLGSIGFNAERIQNIALAVAGTDAARYSQLTDHTGDASIHYTQASITITESQISDLGAYITSVADDPSPVLSNYLGTNGFGFSEQYTATAGNNFVAGEVGYYIAAGTITKADASAEATANGLLVMATETINGGNSGRFVQLGQIKGLSGLTGGAVYYLSTTAGAITTTAPTGSGEIVRPVGRAKDANTFSFQADGTWIELN